jgi:flagellar biosynthesis/type III secretory pathway M-ring protein FliF/YscJ
MDVVNQGLARLADLVKAMTPTARLTAALSLAFVVASLVWLFGQHVAPGDTYLMGGQPFSAAQLQHMEGALGKAGLTEYQIEGARIRVPDGQQAKYMAALAEAGALPADFGEYLQKAVNNNGFMLYGSRQEAQLKVAIQTELQGVINNFQGVERSFVQIAEETSQSFPRVKTVTASVSVQPSAGHPLDERAASAIRSIVASAWGGLKPESVTVVDSSCMRLFEGPLNGSSASAGAYAENKKQLELDWQEKIARTLGIPGAIVTANVELNEDGHTPRLVSVSLAVPQAHFAAVWHQLHGLPPGTRPAKPDRAALAELERNESDRIKQAIIPLLVADDPAVDRNSLVAVSTIYAPLAPAGAVPGFEAVALDWLTANWRTVGLGLLILIVLAMLRSTFRSAGRPATAQLHAADEPQSLFLVTEPDQPAAAAARAPIPAPHMPVDARRAELAEMIRQDPEGAASVLRTWIGNAS